ncbi:MAG: lipopolysaccharide biosynthesis protein, partial [Muribaculaceae bacterium]|nr:lipopolysaccharide biosynthesis protein [Muribaculaceae bacterium]
TEAILDIAPFFIITAGIFAITHFATLWIHNNIALLIAKVLLGALLYIAVMKFAKVKIFDECYQFLRKKLKNK